MSRASSERWLLQLQHSVVFWAGPALSISITKPKRQETICCCAPANQGRAMRRLRPFRGTSERTGLVFRVAVELRRWDDVGGRRKEDLCPSGDGTETPGLGDRMTM